MPLPTLRSLTSHATPWRLTMTVAGVPTGALRDDYTAAARLAARRYPAFYSVIRLLFPPAWQPHFYALSAFALYADCLVDVPVRQCDPSRFHAWAGQVRRGLLTGQADQPFLRAFLHTVDVRSVAHRDVEDYLVGQAERLWTTGYATEQDHDDTVDHIGMPAARMQCAVWLAAAEPVPERPVRLVMDAAQRVDDLADLAADLRRGFLTIPETELLRFGASRTDLETGRDTCGVRALLTHMRTKARTALAAARAALGDADDATQFVYGLVLAGCDPVMSGVEHQGAALPRHGIIRQVRPSPCGLLNDARRVLVSRLRVAW
ncbi:squalene/phytoene synthase family protein [Streptomyces sp. NPDC050161]|uniref:squalene/phytoene synthase family protein n=1 Tax=Streptomyces sp. NPDC050161 TaxID=3365604 RepID=UPI0037B6B2BF